MKTNATKRLLALLLTLAMLLPNFTGTMLTAHAATTTAEPNVYDIYDLTGSMTNTIKGTDETWDGQIHAKVKEEHKENIVLKTKLTMGAQAAENLGGKFDIPMKKGKEQPVVVIRGQGAAVEMRCPYMRLLNQDSIFQMDECEVEGDLNCHNPPPTIFVSGKIPSFAMYPYGKGSVGIIPVSFGRAYLQEQSWELKRFVMNCADAMGVGRAKVNQGGTVELLVTEKDGKTYAHLMNLLGEHRAQTVKTFESIPAATDIQVEIPLANKPEFVKLQPENREIPYKRTHNGICISLPKVELYTIIEIG